MRAKQNCHVSNDAPGLALPSMPSRVLCHRVAGYEPGHLRLPADLFDVT